MNLEASSRILFFLSVNVIAPFFRKISHMIRKDQYRKGIRDENPGEKVDRLIAELYKNPPNISVCAELRAALLELPAKDKERRRRASNALKRC